MSRYVPLSRSRFGDAGYIKSGEYHFADQQPIIEVVAQELPHLLPYFPLAFSPRNAEGDLSLVAVLSLLPDRNLFVHPSGRWLANYVPAQFRGHPYCLISTPDGKRVLGVDTQSELLTETPSERERFYDGEGPSENTQRAVTFLQQFDQQRQVSRQAVLALQEADVIQPWNINRRSEGGKAKAVEGLYRIDEDALKALPAEALSSLARSGALDIAYGQLFSMPRLKVVSRLEEQHAQAENRTAGAKDLDVEALFGEDDDLTFNFDD